MSEHSVLSESTVNTIIVIINNYLCCVDLCFNKHS